MNVQAAARAARKAIESCYDGICTIYRYKNVTDAGTCITEQKKEILYEAKPCHLSYETITSAEEGSGAAAISQAVKLFCAPELCIEPGCRIEVVQAGRTEIYERSGKGAVYSTHQEVLLKLSDQYA